MVVDADDDNDDNDTLSPKLADELPQWLATEHENATNEYGKHLSSHMTGTFGAW
jgi:hypothetical protein